MCYYASLNAEFGNFCSQLWVQITSLVCFIGTVVPLYCLRKRVPVNYALLFAMTIFESFMFCALTAQLTPESVLLAIGVLAAILVSLFSGALLAPSFKKLLVFLIVALLVCFCAEMTLLIYLFYSLFVPTFNVVLYAGLECIIAGAYIIIDLYMLMAPKDAGGFDLDDYILGALCLYVDIMRLFLYLLILLGKRKK